MATLKQNCMPCAAVKSNVCRRMRVLQHRDVRNNVTSWLEDAFPHTQNAEPLTRTMRRAVKRWRRANSLFQRDFVKLDNRQQAALLHSTDILAEIEGVACANNEQQSELSNALTQLQLATDLLVRARDAIGHWERAAEDARAAMQSALAAQDRLVERVNNLHRQLSERAPAPSRWIRRQNSAL